MIRAKAALAALLTLLTLSAILAPVQAQAVAVPQAAAIAAVPEVATTALYPYVAPITCENYTACVLDYYGGTSAPNDGYWMAKRRVNGTIWVRLTSVPGMNNQSVANISCTTEDMCVQDYYDCNIWVQGCYWMAKNAGNVWVRETLMYGS